MSLSMFCKNCDWDAGLVHLTPNSSPLIHLPGAALFHHGRVQLVPPLNQSVVLTFRHFFQDNLMKMDRVPESKLSDFLFTECELFDWRLQRYRPLHLCYL